MRRIHASARAPGTGFRTRALVGGAVSTLLLRAFGRPRGVLGWLGGRVMARTNREANRWVVDLLGIEAATRALEVGCGPGAGLAEALAREATFVCGVDPGKVMLN